MSSLPSPITTANNNPEQPWMTLLRIRECFGYVLPPRISVGNQYCESWKLDKPMFTGELIISAREELLVVRLVANNVLFADGDILDCNTIQFGDGDFDETSATTKNAASSTKAPLKRKLDSFIEPTRDSSRYFAIRIRDPASKRVIPFGVGFRERSTAFDFQAAIMDRIRAVQRSDDIDRRLKETAERDAKEIAEATAKLTPKHDYSIPKGERIHVELKVPEIDDQEDSLRSKPVPRPSISLIESGGALKLAPPPMYSATVAEDHKKSHDKSAKHQKKHHKEIIPNDANLTQHLETNSMGSSGDQNTRKSMVDSTEEEDEWEDFSSASTN